MLAGDLVTLRGIERDDVPLLHAWDQDYATWPEVSLLPYVPTSLHDALAAYDDGKDSPYRPNDTSVPFAVTVGGELVGGVTLWGIDLHNRRAHLGILVGPSYRGLGYGTDACRVLLRYAFVERGLHRVQLETLTTNAAGRTAYERAGFVVEGVLRQSAWVSGALIDEVIMSALSTDPGQPTTRNGPT